MIAINVNVQCLLYISEQQTFLCQPRVLFLCFDCFIAVTFRHRFEMLIIAYSFASIQLDDGYYNLQQKNIGASSGGGGGNNVVNSSEGYSYAYSDEVPSLQSTQNRQQQPLQQPPQHQQHQQKSTSSSHRDQQQLNRARRTQRRVTHNEKRYHSGKRFTAKTRKIQKKITTTNLYCIRC